jgi:hypothetical protein
MRCEQSMMFIILLFFCYYIFFSSAESLDAEVIDTNNDTFRLNDTLLDSSSAHITIQMREKLIYLPFENMKKLEFNWPDPHYKMTMRTGDVIEAVPEYSPDTICGNGLFGPHTCIKFDSLKKIEFITVPDSVVTGPYKVSFDIGLTRNDYNVTISDPKVTEQLSGAKEIDYSFDITNDTGPFRHMTITTKHFEKERPILSGSDLKRGLMSVNANDPRISGFKSNERRIDGANGAVASYAAKVDSEHIFDLYQAVYQPMFDPTHTVVEIFSSYPWDEGTLKLLRTIHVTKAT